MGGLFSGQTPLQDERLSQLGIRKPFVSVIVTNYNYARYIIPCLKSIAGQSYDPFECVVVDDCSSDGSAKLIEDFVHSLEANGRFSLIRHEVNSGQMAAFKTGLEHARGTFVTFVDADDLLFDDFLRVHIGAHLSSLPVAFTSSNQFQIDRDDQIIAGTHPDLRHTGQKRLIGPQPLYRPFWVWATTSSMMFRRAVLEMILPEDCTPFRVCADNYLCHFANLIGGSMLIPDVHGCYRRHGNNCFSGNPIVGGRLPTGDMNGHPKHNLVRAHILKHLLAHRDKFVTLLGEDNFAYAIARADNPIRTLLGTEQYLRTSCSSMYLLRACSLLSLAKASRNLLRGILGLPI